MELAKEDASSLTVCTEVCSDDISFVSAGLAETRLIDSSAEFEQKYTLGAELGRGASSIVYSAVCNSGDRADGCFPLAVKIMSKDIYGMSARHFQQRMRDECRVLTELKHPQLIELVRIYECPRMLHILMERAEGGALFDRIVACGFFTEPHAMHVMRQLLSVIAFMHGHGVIHRDIKAENLLLVSHNSWDIKVSDFGLVKIFGDGTSLASSLPVASCPFEESKVGQATSLVGTGYYKAPEIRQALPSVTSYAP